MLHLHSVSVSKNSLLHIQWIEPFWDAEIMGYMRVNEQTVHSCSAYFYLLANYQNKSSMVCHLKIKKLEITVSFLYLLYNIVTIYFLFCLIFLFNNHHNKNNDIFYSNIELVKNSGNVPFEIWPQVERYFWNCCRKILELVNLSIKSHIFKFFLNRSALKGFYTKKNLQSKNEFLAFFFFFFCNFAYRAALLPSV